MKNFLTLILLLSVLPLFAQQQQVIIKGKIKGLEGHELRVSYKNGDKMQYDKIVPQNEKFEVKFTISETQEVQVYTYRFTKNAIRDTINKFYYAPPGMTLFLAPGDKIKIKGNAMNMWEAKVTGGKYLKEYRQFNAMMVPLINKERKLKMAQYEMVKKGNKAGQSTKKEEIQLLAVEKKAATKKFFTDNPDNEYALFKFLQGIKSLQPEEIESIYESYSPAMQQTTFGEKILQFIETNKEVGPGKHMIDFTGPALDGSHFESKNLRGKYVLLDFWGSWCGPCRKSNPHLKELYAQYKPKGFEIVGIAYEMMATLEKNKQATLQAVKEDGLLWIQLLNNELAETFDVVKAYNVGAFPTKILIDPSGTILWKGIGGDEEELDKWLGKIFGE